MKFFLIGALFAFGLPSFVLAHHSKGPFYEVDKMAELEGEVTRILWSNPHVRFWVDHDGNGSSAAWEVETTPPGILARHGIGADILAVGQTIRIAGFPGRDGAPIMDVRNILLPDGREILIDLDTTPRWTDNTIGWDAATFSDSEIEAAKASASGIFRVWSRDFGIERERNNRSSYPLTPTAQSFQDNYDAVADNPIPGCTPKSMPHLMGQPYPIQFVDEGDQVRLHIEEYDIVRTIHMTGASESMSNTSLGHSVGRWEGRTLIVSTSGISKPYFNSTGILLSDAAEIEERFDLSQNESRLDYQMTVTDPATFSEPVSQERYWLWRPGESIQPFHCIESAYSAE